MGGGGIVVHGDSVATAAAQPGSDPGAVLYYIVAMLCYNAL